MEKLWSYIFDNLKVDPSKCTGVVLTETVRNSRGNRERMAQILFNTFKVPNCYLVRAAEMSLAATGRTTGIVVESGEGVTQVLPVFEGFSIPHAIKKTNFAGRELTK